MVEFDSTNIISEFQKLGIPIFTRGHREFELSVATGNFLYRYHRPTWVVRPRNGEDVATTVRAANSLKVRITVKNGGHSYAGFSNAGCGILLDMSSMKAVTINDSGSGKLLTCSAGALWFDVYLELASDSDRFDKWIANGGRCPAVGVTGFILGGGFGPFSRSLGIGSDQLVQAELVTVDGKVITVSKDRDGDEGKLFWALRGCGGGNFGIVTKLKIDIVPLADKWVVAGRLVWTVAKASLVDESFTQLMTDLYTAKWDDKMTIDSTWSCDLTRATDDGPFATRFITYYDGVKNCFDNEIDRNLRKTGCEPPIYANIRKQIKRRSTQEPSTLFLHETLGSQWVEETRRSLPTERAYTLYSSWVIQNERSTIEAIVEIIPKRIDRFRKKFGGSGDRGTFEVTWIHVGGKISEAQDEGSYPWRAGNYCIYILVRWHEKWLTEEMGKFFDDTKGMFKEHAMEKKASYVNFGDRYLDGWEEAYYGHNLEKLREVYDTWVVRRKFEGHQALNFPQSIGCGPESGLGAVEALEETEEALKKTEEALEETEKAQEETEEAQEETEKAQEETEKAQEETEKAQEETEKAQEETEKAPEETEKAPEETGKAQEKELAESHTAFDTWNDLLSHWQNFVPASRSFDHFVTMESRDLPRC